MRYLLIGFTPKEKLFIQDVLNDIRGWAGQGYIFTQGDSKAEHDVVLFKKSQADMTARFPQPHLMGMSVCDRATRPIEIWINRNNWTRPPKVFIGTRDMYRAYVVQHEMGHALGYHHEDPPADKEEMCPVMYQQTRGTKNICRSNPWRL